MVEERPDYDALAQDINLEDITSCEHNANILRKLRDGDPLSKQLYIMDREYEEADPDEDFFIDEGDDLGWLGHFIGRSEVLQDLQIWHLPEGGDQIISFFEGMSQNRSIKGLVINCEIGDDGWNRLGIFLENNRNIARFTVEDFLIGQEGTQNLALALGRMNHNFLTDLSICHTGISDEGMTEIVTALGSQSQLEKLFLYDNNMGRDGCIALGNTLSRWPASNKLKTLHIDDNAIDDGGLQVLAEGLMKCQSFKTLDLSDNRSITEGGLRSLFPLLQSESLSLERLDLSRIAFGDDGAIVLADSLRGNKSLKELLFSPSTSGITVVGWSAFSKLLCDTSTINSTYLSHHTLTTFGDYLNEGTPQDIKRLLSMNRYQEAAICKILQSHRDLDMAPFFKLKMKFLPAVISWFERVERIDMGTIMESERSFQSRKLSALYKFVRGMPDLAVIGYWQGRVIYIEAKKRMLDDEEAVAWERLGGRPIDDASKRKRMRHE